MTWRVNFWRWYYENDYKDYLTCWRWKRKRRKVLRRDKSCVICGSIKSLQVHHRTYARIFAERLSDLTTLCSVCHFWVENSRKTQNEILIPHSN